MHPHMKEIIPGKAIKLRSQSLMESSSQLIMFSYDDAINHQELVLLMGGRVTANYYVENGIPECLSDTSMLEGYFKWGWSTERE